MDGGALASPIGATATAVAPTTPKGKVTGRVTLKPKKAKTKRVTIMSLVKKGRKTMMSMTSSAIRRTPSRRKAALLAATVAFLVGPGVGSAAADFGDGFGVVPGSYFAGTCQLPAVTGSETTPAAAVEKRDCHDTSTLAPETAVPVTQAGAHPDGTVAFVLNPVAVPYAPYPDGHVRDVIVDLPPGLVGNPTAVPTCRGDLWATGRCPVETQVGTLELRLSNYVPLPTLNPQTCVNQPNPTTYPQFSLPDGGRCRIPINNLNPSVGEVASFGFNFFSGINVAIQPMVRSDGDYGIQMRIRNVPQQPALSQSIATLWGVPSDPVHDPFRFRVGPRVGTDPYGIDPGAPWPAAVPRKPFLSNPTYCDGNPPRTILRVRSWQHPETWLEEVYDPPAVTGCDQLPFDPSADIEPTTSAPDAPAGLNVDLKFPQEGMEDPTKFASAHLKKAIVTLPEGMTINPSGAHGLASCSDTDLKLNSKDPVTCPDAAKVGTVTAKSPVLEETLSGGVYIRSQNSNDPESGEMFRIALVLENAERGLSIRLPGQIRANRQTGRLETTFDNNPQLPVSDINLKFKDGPTAPLATPPTCGPKTIDTVLSSWGGQTKSLQSTFNVPCLPGMGSFDLGFAAGTKEPIAGASSPFNLVVARQDGDKELKAIKSVRLPEGLLGRVASVPLCGEAQAAAGTCSEASRVGHVQAALGAGSSPLWVPQAGREPTAVYLSGPWRGAPYSLSIVVPAQAGPFDLGRVVVRSALHVDERTAAITTGVDETRLIDADGTVTEVLSGALPRILKGIVLNQREIRAIVDRDDFMVNPTDCSLKQITAEIYSVDGDRADVGNRFRVADCALLGFKPKFRAKILDKGRRSTLRSFHPRTRFAVVPRKGDANIGGARVVLPSSTLLDQANIGTTCTRAQMAARACPEKSVVGYAKAWSPLLREVVEGPVYLAANGGVRPLPDLAAVLDGEIRVVLQGEISTQRSGGKARLQNTFRVVPDAPVSRFVLTMRGGKNRGLLANSTDLCRSNERGAAVFTGQNNRRSRTALRLTPSFKGCRKVRRQAARKAAARKAAARKTARRNATQR